MTTLPAVTSTSTAHEVASVFAAEIKGKNGAFSAIEMEIPTANIRKLILDLSSHAGVRKAAEEVNTYMEPLHLTVDSLENQITTDRVGPFLLSLKLLTSVTPTYTPRVVFGARLAHAFGTGVDPDFLAHPDPEKYAMSPVYCQAKAANILTAIELSKRSKGRTNAYSIQPGVVYTNMAQKEESLEELKTTGMLTADRHPDRDKWEWKTIPQGTATTVAAAFDPRLDDKPGAFLDNSTVANESVAAHSSDPVPAEKTVDGY
ncbi:hypothetical protein C8R43DRAFT_962927 [Mycena crocata]|nr:hypothetical protein C8R43DRAFT_962927 [Mycena crocata]